VKLLSASADRHFQAAQAEVFDILASALGALDTALFFGATRHHHLKLALAVITFKFPLQLFHIDHPWLNIYNFTITTKVPPGQR
jgi:hypothetical protein